MLASWQALGAFSALGQTSSWHRPCSLFPGTRATAGAAPNPAPEKRGVPGKGARKGAWRAWEGEGSRARLRSPIPQLTGHQREPCDVISLRKAAGT